MQCPPTPLFPFCLTVQAGLVWERAAVSGGHDVVPERKK
jgi:hypothetical protein